MFFCESKHSVCSDCRIHFEPYDDYVVKEGLADYCPKCRTPLLEIQRRKEAVKKWAVGHLEEVEGLMKQEWEDFEKYHKTMDVWQYSFRDQMRVQGFSLLTPEQKASLNKGKKALKPESKGEK